MERTQRQPVSHLVRSLGAVPPDVCALECNGIVSHPYGKGAHRAPVPIGREHHPGETRVANPASDVRVSGRVHAGNLRLVLALDADGLQQAGMSGGREVGIDQHVGDLDGQPSLGSQRFEHVLRKSSVGTCAAE